MILADFTFPPWLLALGGAFTVVATLGGAFVILRSSIATKTTELWKQQAEAFSARLTASEDTAKDLQIENDKCRIENEALKGRVQTLESTVTAGPAIEQLRRDMATQHTEILGVMHKSMGGASRGKAKKKKAS